MSKDKYEKSGKIANSAEYRMENQFTKLRIFEAKF